MTTNNKSTRLYHFSWEEWDQQLIVVIHRSERRFVVKRYVERVLSNSNHWQRLAQSSFSNVEPIPRAYRMTEHDVKLMQQIFSWHLNGTLKFPIIAGLDQLLDWEDLLDFIERAENTKDSQIDEQLTTQKSPSIVPTIPVGLLVSSAQIKTTNENNNSSDQTVTKTDQNKSTKSIKSDQSQQTNNENILPSSAHQWVQVNNVFVPYIVKSTEKRFLPYQVLLDCDLLSQEEQSLLQNLTIPASPNDVHLFEQIIHTSSSIDFQLAQELLLIDLEHVLFGITKIPYVKLLRRQREVNKSYKHVLAQTGGTIQYLSHSIPFIHLHKFNYILMDSVINIFKPTSKIQASLRRRAIVAQSYEVDYLRLVQFYMMGRQEDQIYRCETQSKLLICTKEVSKLINNVNLSMEHFMIEYHQVEQKKLMNTIETSQDRMKTRKATKRKAMSAMSELNNTSND